MFQPLIDMAGKVIHNNVEKPVDNLSAGFLHIIDY